MYVILTASSWFHMRSAKRVTATRLKEKPDLLLASPPQGVPVNWLGSEAPKSGSINFKVDEALAAELDRVASRFGITRSAAVRACVRSGLAVVNEAKPARRRRSAAAA